MMNSISKGVLRIGCSFILLAVGVSGQHEHCPSYFWSATFYYGFDCPTEFDSSDKIYCCGNPWIKFCCNYNTWLTWGIRDDAESSSVARDSGEGGIDSEDDIESHDIDSEDNGDSGSESDGDNENLNEKVDESIGKGTGHRDAQNKKRAGKIGIDAILMVVFGMIGIIGLIVTATVCLTKSGFFGARNATTIEKLSPQLTTISSVVANENGPSQSYMDPPPPYDTDYPSNTKDSSF